MSVYSAQSSVDPLSKVSYSSYEPASQVFLDSHIGVSGPHIRQFLKWQDRNIRKAYLEWRHWEGRLSTDQRALLEQLYGQLVNLREGLRQQSTTLRHSWGPDVLQTTKLYRITSSTFQTHVKQTTEQARKRAKAEARAAQERSSRSSAAESSQLTSPIVSPSDTSSDSETSCFQWSSLEISSPSPESVRSRLPTSDIIAQTLEEIKDRTPELLELAIGIVGTVYLVDKDREQFTCGVQALLDLQFKRDEIQDDRRVPLAEALVALPDLLIVMALDMFELAAGIARDSNGTGTGAAEDEDNFASQCEKVIREVCHKARSWEMLPPALFKDTDEIQVDLTERCDSGGYGTVWMAKIEGRAVAIKILNTVLSDDHEHVLPDLKRFSREVIIWRQLHHRNILPLLGLCRACPPPAQPGPGMISPWCKNGNLNSYLRKQLRRNRSVDYIHLLERIADALSYMHRHDAVHKDLKLLNIVVDDNLEPCLTDFGITTFASSRTVSREPGSSGSCRWMAPEVFRRPGETDADVRNRVTAACDMYGFACVCLEMYTLKYPWHDIRSEEEVEINVLAGERPPRPDGIPDEVWSIMESCWVQDRQDRMKSEDAHKAFAAMLA